jgi:hypothetical protein
MGNPKKIGSPALFIARANILCSLHMAHSEWQRFLLQVKLFALFLVVMTHSLRSMTKTVMANSVMFL